MFYSAKLNILFIAAPKTGSTSVENFLLQLDPDGERFKITLSDRVVDSSQVKSASLGHATAREFRKILGSERYDSMLRIGFVRHPVEKMVSAYHFTRGSSLSSAFRIKSAKSKWPLAGKRIAALLAARAMPFAIWARVYPMKRCSDYFLDEHGRSMVTFLGCTDRLTGDLQGILHAAGVDTGAAQVPHLNRSKQSDQRNGLADGNVDRYVRSKYANDVLLYGLVERSFVNCEGLDLPAPMSEHNVGLSPLRSAIKRAFDVVGAGAGLLLTGWLILLAWILASSDTRSNGFFMQKRVGQYGRPFNTIKIRTMRNSGALTTNVTTSDDPRITWLGRFWRRTKIDELPQLWNVLIGNMSFVGPRPDVPGFADELQGDDRIILTVRPGITGPATLKYRNEESLLASVEDPDKYNRDVIYPDKVRINRDYIENWSFWQDMRYILATLFGPKHA